MVFFFLNFSRKQRLTVPHDFSVLTFELKLSREKFDPNPLSVKHSTIPRYLGSDEGNLQNDVFLSLLVSPPFFPTISIDFQTR